MSGRRDTDPDAGSGPEPRVDEPSMNDSQQAHWERTFGNRSDFLGAEPSAFALAAIERFRAAGARTVLELGAGQGRDTLGFARAGFSVTALDYASAGLERITARAAELGVASHLTTVQGDVRQRLPFDDGAFDAAYAHMLLCMALATPELETLSAEIRRVLRPGGLLIYTVRNTTDAHFQAGVAHGDDMYEMGGFVVHFFDRTLVDQLAAGYRLIDIAEAEEGKLPRRLFVVTQARA